MIYVILLLVIAVITHLAWFTPGTILTFGDFGHFANETAKRLTDYQGTWRSLYHFGQVNPLASSYPIDWLISRLVNLGFSADDANKIVIFIPVAIIGFIAPYILFRKITANKMIAFVAALFYGSTTYFLIKETQHIMLGAGYALAPLVFYCFLSALEANNLRHWLIFDIVFSISIYYEIRITFITFFILIVYFLFFHISSLKKYLPKILAAAIVGILLNAFWLLPLAFSSYGQGVAAVTDRSTWGDTLFSMSQALTIHESSWTGGYPDWSFIREAIPGYLWLIPVLTALPLIFLNKFNPSEKRNILFFAIIALVGIFLTKQSAHPVTGAYRWLYYHFPGFNLFREASKFFGLTAFGYAGLITSTLVLMKKWKNKYLFPVAIAIVLVIASLNLRPLINGQIGGLFTSQTMPDDYKIITDYFRNDRSYYRFLFIPSISRWFPASGIHPAADISAVVTSDWKDFIQFSDKSGMPNAQDLIQIMKKRYVRQLLAAAAIRYVVVPERNNFFIAALDKLSYLKRVDIGTKNIIFYEIFDNKPHIYLTEDRESIDKSIPWRPVKYEQVNSDKYIIDLSGINRPVYLNFAESYNSGWTIAGAVHFKNAAQFNSYYVDPAKICPGAAGCRVTLLFNPGQFLQAGLKIAVITFTLCIIYLFVFK